MSKDNMSQLVGAMGAWLEAAPAGVPVSDRTRTTALILDGSLLGVRTTDVAAGELAELTKEDEALVSSIRAWAYPDEFDLVPPEPEPETPQVGVPQTESQAKDLEAKDLEAKDLEAQPAEPAQPGPAAPGRTKLHEPSRTKSTASVAPTGAVPQRRAAPSQVAPRVPVTKPDQHPVLAELFPHDPLSTAPEQSRGRPAWLREEVFWWTMCFVALVVLIVRRLF